MNRVGDFGFALGVIFIFWTFGTLNYADVFAQAPKLFAVGAPVVTAITLLLFMGATGKSAQIPLYVWLPDAMEGPTPVTTSSMTADRGSSKKLTLTWKAPA